MDKNIILASGSPRRQELLRMLGLRFEVIVDKTPEPDISFDNIEENVCALASFKGENVIKKLEKDKGYIVIAADTIVAIGGKVLGKPKDEEDAFKMLSALSGNMHCVFTGVFVKDTETGKESSFFEKTEVFFKKLDINEIKDYIRTREPMDKAGSYGIQNLGSIFVEKINGDYFNVVGLPVSKLAGVLKEDFGIKIF
ncbi:MAG: septum formation protein Maf [Clostridia bacterium]|nr:septum formation protein Maf [Clostridia bacterium]